MADARCGTGMGMETAANCPILAYRIRRHEGPPHGSGLAIVTPHTRRWLRLLLLMDLIFNDVYEVRVLTEHREFSYNNPVPACPLALWLKTQSPSGAQFT